MSPQVSIIIPTYNRTKMLMERSLPSAMNQTFEDIEIIVVGDGTEQATVDAMSQITDPRVRFYNLPRSTYPSDKKSFWQVGGVAPLNWGLDNARGEWVGMLGDDDALAPNHVELLLNITQQYDIDYIYGCFLVMTQEGIQAPLEDGFVGGGAWPPEKGNMGNGIWKASLPFRYNYLSWQSDEPCDWEFVTRLMDGGVKFGFLPEVTYLYYPNLLASREFYSGV